MLRNCFLYKSSERYQRHVYIDSENAEEIYNLLQDTRVHKKFDYIINRILSQNFIYYEEYEKLKGFNSVSEMRLFPNGLNIRLYCKEIATKSGNFYVVVAKLLEKKKSGKLNNKIKENIKPLETYEYRIT